jgi:hypothetical protein
VKTKIVTIVLMVLAVALALPILWVCGLFLINLTMIRAGTSGIAAVVGGISFPLLALGIVGAVVVVLLRLLITQRRR